MTDKEASTGANPQCPIGEHWVRTHYRTRITNGKKTRSKVEGHCRINPSHFEDLAIKEGLDLETLYFALTLFGEVRGQNETSRNLIAWVIRNRYTRHKGKKAYQELVTKPAQFSCWLASDPNYKLLKNPSEAPKIPDRMAWGQIKALAKEVKNAAEAKNPIPGVCHYFSGAPNIKDHPWQKVHFKMPGAPAFSFVKLK